MAGNGCRSSPGSGLPPGWFSGPSTRASFFARWPTRSPFCPPLIIRPAEVDFLFDVVRRALDQVAAELAREARAAVA